MYTSTTSSTTSGSTASVWESWTATVSYGNGTSSTVTADHVWNVWSSGGTATTSYPAYSTTGTWVKWVGEHTPVETAEQKAERETRWAEEAKIRKEKEEAKTKKARQLLREVLSEEQNKQLDDKGYFELVSVDSGQRYRVNKGRTRNVQKLDNAGKVIKQLCFHPAAPVHDYDTMAIQAIMLRNDEAAVQKVANFS
jgi:hypothetical protein